MILLADLIDRYSSDLLSSHGFQLLPSHHQALRAMRRCRNQHSKVMLMECHDCQHQTALPHSCGHRSCPIANSTNASNGLSARGLSSSRSPTSW